MIRFGLDKAAWQPQDIGVLGDTLCEFEHRFSKHSTDLGHVTVDPYRIVLVRKLGYIQGTMTNIGDHLLVLLDPQLP